MASTIYLYRLLRTYQGERARDSAEPPLETAARVLACAGERLDRHQVRYLVDRARSAFARDGIPPELRLSPRTAFWLDWDAHYPEIDRDERLAAGLVERERTALLSAGLVEYDRSQLSPWEALQADLAAGRRSLRDLSRAEYDEWNIEWLPDECGLSPAHLILFGGWIPIGILAIVAGSVVGLVSGDWSLFLATVLGGTIAGYVAAIAAVITYVALDDRWLRLGHQVNAAYVVFLSVGSAVALLVAVLVPDSGLGLDLAVVLDSAVSNYRMVLWPVLLVLALRAIARQLRQ